MASISFWGAAPASINNLSGSGISFMGSSFGQSIAVSEYNSTTWISNGAGTTDGGQINNIQFFNQSSGSINGAAPVHLRQIPNYLATLHIKFNHDTAVKTQNAKLRIYDRANINNDPSGVTCKVYECRHVDTAQTLNGSGADTWSTPHGSSVVLDLVSSPGISGLRPNAGNTMSTEHLWALCLSASPDSIGSKQNFALWFSTEFL